MEAMLTMRPPVKVPGAARARASMRLSDLLRHEEGAARVGVHHEVVVGFGHVRQCFCVVLTPSC